MCAEWANERRKHPFYLEKMTESQIAACWDDSAPTYDGGHYSEPRRRIISDLRDRGVLHDGCSVLDIGCGPGVYDVEFSPFASEVLCMDGSRPMLDRLDETIAEKGLGNLSTCCCRWEDFDPGRRFNVSFTSLCPGLNDPASVLRMEDYADEHCVFISSAKHMPGLSIEVWKELGMECSFKGYDTRYPYEFLRLSGREPTLDFYSSSVEYVHDVEGAVDMQVRYFSKHREMTPELRRVIEDVVRSHEVEGTVTERKVLTLGMLVWEPLL